MSRSKVLFVYRKAHKGNFSIEKVYDSIFLFLKNKKIDSFDFEKITLNRTYDIFQFIKSFLISLIKKKHTVHITGGCNYMVMAFPFKTRVLSIHDFYHYRKFKGIKKYLYDTFFYKLPIHFSHKIITVSGKTKNDLMKFFDIAEKKIKVIENPLLIPKEKIIFRNRTFSRNETVQILQIGDKPLKNYERLIEATKNLNVFYHFVHSNTDKIMSILKEHNLSENSKIYSGISDDELFELYSVSDVLFFASEAEGFGLPILEAQAFNLPVITSNLPPMDYVGKGSILVDPFDVTSISNGFTKLYNARLLETNTKLSKENLKKYSITKVANRYFNLYRALA